MTYVQLPKESFVLLGELKSKYPQYSSIIDNVEQDLNQRLWHQLSENLLTLSQKEELQTGNDLVLLYNMLIIHVESAFNPMKLLQLIQNILYNYLNNMDEALLFINNIENKLQLKGEELLLLKILKGFCYLHLNRLYDCEDIIKSVKVQIEKRFEVEQAIYANFYKLSTYYYEKKENHDEFYNNAFQYLAYVKNISDKEKINLCFKMCVASLIGEKMFNFAELIEKDFFKILQNSPYDWIYYIILAFNSAKVSQFYAMVDKYAHHFNSNKTLRDNVEFLHVKIRIAALLDLVFQKNKNERVLTYKEISENCLLDYDKLEPIVIKALSLGLIKGYIDEVENKVVVNWVQPKYLDREKIQLLHERLDQWIRKTGKVLGGFQETAAQLLV